MRDIGDTRRDAVEAVELLREKINDQNAEMAYNKSAMVGLIEQHRQQIAVLCGQYGIKRLELFGSAASGDFKAGHSDADFFYEFDLTDQTGLADRFFNFHRELETLLGGKVDLISAPDATNPYFLPVANRHRLALYAA